MDIADQAQDSEAVYRRVALARGRTRPMGRQLVIDGCVRCAECGEPIPAARLTAVPGVALCRDCQEDAECC